MGQEFAPCSSVLWMTPAVTPITVCEKLERQENPIFSLWSLSMDSMCPSWGDLTYLATEHPLLLHTQFFCVSARLVKYTAHCPGVRMPGVGEGPRDHHHITVMMPLPLPAHNNHG